MTFIDLSNSHVQVGQKRDARKHYSEFDNTVFLVEILNKIYSLITTTLCFKIQRKQKNVMKFFPFSSWVTVKQHSYNTLSLPGGPISHGKRCTEQHVHPHPYTKTESISPCRYVNRRKASRSTQV